MKEVNIKAIIEEIKSEKLKEILQMNLLNNLVEYSERSCYQEMLKTSVQKMDNKHDLDYLKMQIETKLNILSMF